MTLSENISIRLASVRSLFPWRMKHANCKGVTLIELLIGMAILALILGLGLPSISTWMQNTQLRSAADAVQSGLQLARAEAVKRNTSVGFTMAGPDS